MGMDFTSHEIRRGLVIGIPLLVLALLGIWRRWLFNKNQQISAVLQKRGD